MEQDYDSFYDEFFPKTTGTWICREDCDGASFIENHPPYRELKQKYGSVDKFVIGSTEDELQLFRVYVENLYIARENHIKYQKKMLKQEIIENGVPRDEKFKTSLLEILSRAISDEVLELLIKKGQHDDVEYLLSIFTNLKSYGDIWDNIWKNIIIHAKLEDLKRYFEKYDTIDDESGKLKAEYIIYRADIFEAVISAIDWDKFVYLFDLTIYKNNDNHMMQQILEKIEYNYYDSSLSESAVQEFKDKAIRYVFENYPLAKIAFSSAETNQIFDRLIKLKEDEFMKKMDTIIASLRRIYPDETDVNIRKRIMLETAYEELCRDDKKISVELIKMARILGIEVSKPDSDYERKRYLMEKRGNDRYHALKKYVDVDFFRC